MRTAPPTRRPARVLLTAALCALTLGAAATPAAADSAASARNHPAEYYLALGDSLAAGYQSLPGGGHVVGRGYAQDLARTLEGRAHAAGRPFSFTDLGCPGETSGSMADGGCRYPHSWSGSQLTNAVSYLKAHRKDRVVVTLDIGANDVDGCASGGSLDLPCALNGIATVRRNLDRILGELRAAAGPHTRIVGMNLYDPFLAAWLTGDQGKALATLSVPLAGALNGVIEQVDAAHRVPTADVAGAFDTGAFLPMVPLGGQLVPLNVARVMQWTNMARGDIHANDAGYQVIADAFLAEL
ncbi:SGNH/GDSL hydrolase family protein [Kitasatospora terrestris]|uniref:SGNH hydrolase-type esterase domain-containing protein n=1 Tax=Kitasatospora terrestris TaxID=258051 RepID=A0ABP9EEQ6_9ACTN